MLLRNFARASFFLTTLSDDLICCGELWWKKVHFIIIRWKRGTKRVESRLHHVQTQWRTLLCRFNGFFLSLIWYALINYQPVLFARQFFTDQWKLMMIKKKTLLFNLKQKNLTVFFFSKKEVKQEFFSLIKISKKTLFISRFDPLTRAFSFCGTDCKWSIAKSSKNQIHLYSLYCT